MNPAAKSLARTIGLTAGFGLCCVLFVLSIDFIELGRRGFVGDENASHGIKAYAERASTYSLVKLGVLDINRDQGVFLKRDAGLVECIGNLRWSSNDVFIDVTALTIAIVGVENYNRDLFRQSAEVALQDALHFVGIEADFSTGIAQIKSSLAEKIYKEKINRYSSTNEIKKFARTNCGSARLAALHVEDLASQCSKELNEISSAGIIQCVARKYTGMNPRQRSYEIYATAVIGSYNKLFDLSNEFYFSYTSAALNIDVIKGGECLDFNPGAHQLLTAPKDKAAESDYSSAKSTAPTEILSVGDERVPYVARPIDGSDVVVKVISSEEDLTLDGRPSASLTVARQKFLAQYSCRKYKTDSVEFYSRPDFIPARIGKYCSGLGSQSPNDDSYILLFGAGKKSNSKDVDVLLCKDFPAQ